MNESSSLSHDLVITKLDTAHRALVEARTMQDVKHIIDMAAAAEVYAKRQSLGDEIIGQAHAIKIEALRRLGEMLKATPRAAGGDHGGRPKIDGTRVVPSIPTPTLKNIGLSKKTSAIAQHLARLPVKQFQQVRDGTSTITKAIRTVERARRPIVVPAAGTYACIVIDPPWEMEKIVREERPRQVGFDYPSMTEDELVTLALPKADDCHLYLWTTHKHLPIALRLGEAWGFHYECLLTWVKNVGFTPYSWMRSTEHVLFCRRGNLTLLRLGLRLDFNAKVREHSRKPDEFYDLVRQASPGPRIDMFAREAHEGFDTWGNETDKFAETA